VGSVGLQTGGRWGPCGGLGRGALGLGLVGGVWVKVKRDVVKTIQTCSGIGYFAGTLFSITLAPLQSWIFFGSLWTGAVLPSTHGVIQATRIVDLPLRRVQVALHALHS